MKNMKLITLGIVFASATLMMAQEAEAIRERSSSPLAEAVIEAPTRQFTHESKVRLAASKEQLKQAERAFATSQRTMQLAQANAGGGGKSYMRTSAGGVGYRNGSAGRVMVIPKDATDAKSLGEVEEDLNVMAHILDKAASSDSRSTRAMGINVFVKISAGGATPQVFYIEGYGALFTLNVNLPLLPPPARESDSDAKEKVNSEWEEARKELSRPSQSGGEEAFAVFGESFDYDFMRNGGDPVTYDAGKVEELKSDLIAALKNAANIRKLKADEFVTVVVTGASAGRGGKTIKGEGSGSGWGGRRTVDPATGLPFAEEQKMVIAESSSGERGAPAKLILRARKADAEAFQNGKLDFDAFRKKVALMVL